MHKEMRNITEIELKLQLLRYNLLSKRESTAAYTCLQTGENMYHNAEWSKCVNEMLEIDRELLSYGYGLTCTGIKTTDKIQYRVYKVIPASDN